MRGRISMRGCVRPFAGPSLSCYFRRTNMAVFWGYEDELVASDVPPRYLFNVDTEITICFPIHNFMENAAAMPRTLETWNNPFRASLLSNFPLPILEFFYRVASIFNRLLRRRYSIQFILFTTLI